VLQVAAEIRSGLRCKLVHDAMQVPVSLLGAGWNRLVTVTGNGVWRRGTELVDVVLVWGLSLTVGHSSLDSEIDLRSVLLPRRIGQRLDNRGIFHCKEAYTTVI
jgi:hypothetical protein